MTDPMIVKNRYSQKPNAVRGRFLSLHSDSHAEAKRNKDKLYRRMKAGERVAKEVMGRVHERGGKDRIRRQVAYHLSRGRSIEDIAIRERIPTSVVRDIVTEVKSQGGAR